MKRSLYFLLLWTFTSITLNAQESESSKTTVSVGVDVASSYIWRGFEFGTTPAFQPWGELSYKGLAVGAWGSYEWNGGYKEIDFYTKFTAGDFTLSLTDLFFPGYVGLNQNFFDFKNSTTGHSAELGLSYNGNEQIPVSLFAGVLLYGVSVDPGVHDATKVNHSMYVEANYNGVYQELIYRLFMGLTPNASQFYQTNDWAVCNVGVSVQKSLLVTKDFSLPLKMTLSTNPSQKNVFLAFILSL